VRSYRFPGCVMILLHNSFAASKAKCRKREETLSVRNGDMDGVRRANPGTGWLYLRRGQ
jgi:hypothetical protein